MTTPESVFLSLYDALHWIAFRRQDAPADEKSVEAHDAAEAKLHQAVLAGRVRLFGRPRPQAAHVEIPVLELERAFFDAVGNVVARSDEPADRMDWQEVRLLRSEVLVCWPDSRERGRWPKANSRAAQVWELFDQMESTFTFKRGERSKVAAKIAGETNYAQNTVEKMIRDRYRELERKASSTGRKVD